MGEGLVDGEGLAVTVTRASGESVGDADGNGDAVASGVVIVTGVANVKENPWHELVKAAAGILCGAAGEIEALRVKYNFPPKNTARKPKAIELAPKIADFQCFFIAFISLLVPPK